MRHGFTLIELMVVVVVILILLGIAAGIGAWASRTSEEALTKTVLMNTQLIYDEYTNTIGGSTTGWAAGSAGISTMVALTKYTGAFKSYYASMPGKTFDFAGNRINDGWGNMVNHVPANIAYSGNPQRPSAYFFSSGPDGNASTTADNVYSFAVLK